MDNKDQVEVIADTINDDNDEEEELELDEKKAFLPRLHFFDFFFNNIYKNNCCNMKNQQIISTCNEIIYKYYSIDTILSNQIILDNLLKCYKWNNPNLNNIGNNELFIKLKTYI